MLDDLIPIKFIPRVRRLGYKGIPTFYKVFRWFRKRWGYTSWVEQSKNKFIYKVYSRGVYHRPIKLLEEYFNNSEPSYPHCKVYEDAEVKLLMELILIVEEKEL